VGKKQGGILRKLQYFQEKARSMVQRDSKRDEMFMAMDAMWQGEWHLPQQLSNLRWIHKVVSTDPHDAVRAGSRVLSAIAPRIKVYPMGDNKGSRAQADKLERALGWFLKQAAGRRRGNILRDIILSALLYDEVAAQVVFLPTQIKALKAFDGDIRKLNSAMAYGPFAIMVRNPRHVHVSYSDLMPDAVLLKRVMPVSEVLGFWGKKAQRLKNYLGASKNLELKYVTVYDYMDLNSRVVWGILQEYGGSISPAMGDPSAEAGAGIEILREKNELGFLPWAVKVGGTNLSDSSVHQRIPLLYSVFQTGQWDTQNILETLIASEVIAYAAAPRLKVEGPTDAVDVDYGEPGRIAYVPPGHQLSKLDAPEMDQSLMMISDRISSRIWKSTIPRVLQTGDFPSGTAFATLNLATQSGVKSLNPYKELAEDVIGEILVQMLRWIKHHDEALVAFGQRKNHPGEQIYVDAKEIDPNRMVVDVELTADIPIDKQAKISAAAEAVRELGFSRTRALEQIGEIDPDVVMEEARREEIARAELEAEKVRILAMGELEAREILGIVESGEETE